MVKLTKEKFIEVGLFLLIVLILLTSCTTKVPAEKQCAGDEDCVPATCCHPSDTVNKESAPNCEGILCSMECVPETIDCGQGEVKCLEGECRVVLN